MLTGKVKSSVCPEKLLTKFQGKGCFTEKVASCTSASSFLRRHPSFNYSCWQNLPTACAHGSRNWGLCLDNAGETLPCLGKLDWMLWFLKIAIVFPVCLRRPWLSGVMVDGAFRAVTRAFWALEAGVLGWGSPLDFLRRATAPLISGLVSPAMALPSVAF